MPIYEFYCPRCHRVSSFLSATVNTTKVPACPQCGGSEMRREASSFAISKGRREEPASPAAGGSDLDDERLAKVMESFAGEMEGLDESDPRQAAALMRRVYEAAGMPVDGRLEEAFRRMEAGEDPEKIEEEMGDVLDEAGLPGAPDEGEPSGEKRLTSLRRRLRQPVHDPELYDL